MENLILFLCLKIGSTYKAVRIGWLMRQWCIVGERKVCPIHQKAMRLT